MVTEMNPIMNVYYLHVILSEYEFLSLKNNNIYYKKNSIKVN